MTYSKYGLIQASDFNNLVGEYDIPNTTKTINAIWGIGTGSIGYGQPQLQNVETNGVVTHTNWSNLIDTMNTIAYRQKSTITGYTAPEEDDVITYLSKLYSNKDTLYLNSGYARQQGTTYIAPTTTVSSTWTDSAVFTHTLTFQSGDKARYFFNSGGQIAITFSHTNGPAVNAMWHEAATNAGTIVISGTLPDETDIITSTNYQSVTRVGGSGDATVYSNHGYYSLTTNYVEIFRKKAFSVFSSYLDSYISVEIKSNGTQGVHGDRGSVITIRTTWNEVPNGSVTSADTGVTVAVRYPYSYTGPATTNYPKPFTNTWGTVIVSGTVVSE